MGARKEIAKRRTVFRCFVVSVAALCVVLLVMQARERALTSFAREHEKENREWAKRWVPQDDLDALFAIDRDSWLREADLTEEFYDTFDGRVPAALRAELDALRYRLTRS